MNSLKSGSEPREGWLGFLSGNQLAIYTLIAIGVLVLVGTILPQRGPTLSEEQFQALANAPGAKGLAHQLGFYDIFHSVWFYALIMILCVNLALCTTFNFQRVYRTSGAKHASVGPALFEQLDELRRFKSRSVKAEVVESLVRPQIKAENNGQWFYRETGTSHRYGAIVTHISIILMAAGAVYGSLFGIDGSMLISEKDTGNTIELRRGGVIELPFTVRCNDFEVEYYEGGRQPKTFRSELTFIPATGAPFDTKIEVNDPAAYGGYRFFQSSYGQTPPKVQIVAIRRSDGQSIPLRPASVRQWVDVENHIHVAVKDVDPNKFNAGLAALLVEEDHKTPPKEFWVFRENPKFDESRPGDYTYTLKAYEAGGWYTGLMVTRNPGLAVFWFGCALGGLGLFLAFFVPHKRLVVHVQNDQITVGYSDSRAGDVPKREADRWVEELKGRTS